jgi:tryptophan synthase alpha chain
MNRIDTTFETCRKAGRKALVMFVSAGDPDLASTEKLIREIVEAGADVVEIGVPFSDPMADGPTIQEASQRALASGTTLSGILAMVERLREGGVDAPFVLFSYYNVLFHYGMPKLAADAKAAGLDGVLVVDVPYEEMGEILPDLQANDLHLIRLVAPTTSPERAAKILADATGFVYTITVTGVTGARNELPPELDDLLVRMGEASPVPVVAGFGVSSPELAKLVSQKADGVVVGSALVKRMAGDRPVAERIADCKAFVASLAAVL